MSYSNDPYDFDSASDAEMIGYPSPPSSPIGSPIAESPLIARSPLIAKSRKSPKNKSNRRSGPRYIPAPSHLTAKDIFEKHPNRLFYNNILKVALHYNNSQIDEKLQQLGYAKGLARARILSATRWIERHFKITSGGFLVALNLESNRSSVYRHVDVSLRDQVLLSHHAAKIEEAMAWVKKGGPRTPAPAPQPKPCSIAAIAPTNDTNKENESEATAASIFDIKLKKAQMSKTHVCPHLYCSCNFTTAKDNYTHIREVHFQAAESLIQRAKARQIAGHLGWVDLP